MKKILVIDESKHFRSYLSEILNNAGFKVETGRNGFDGLMKFKADTPDLVILDYYLSRTTCEDFIADKNQNPLLRKIPILVVASKLDKQIEQELLELGVKSVLSKPVNLDLLINEIVSITGQKVERDRTPCILEAHFNDDILFIEVAQGLNSDKIGLLRFKISELLDLYQVATPQIIIMLTGIEFIPADAKKLDSFFRIVMDSCQTLSKDIKIITKSPFIIQYISGHLDYNINRIKVTGNLMSALEEIKSRGRGDMDSMKEKILHTGSALKEGKETIRLDFDMDRLMNKVSSHSSHPKITIAVVDDDLVVRNLVRNTFGSIGWEVTAYDNGRHFIDDVRNHAFHLVFLDMMMPELDGLGVLRFLNQLNIHTPVIVLSAITQRSAVVQAVGLGIKSYLIKPIKPQTLFLKAAEILNKNIE